MKFGKPNRHDAPSFTKHPGSGLGTVCRVLHSRAHAASKQNAPQASPGATGLGHRTQTPRDLKWQVISVLIMSPPYPCWQQIQGQHISSDTDDTRPETWEIFHRRRFSFFRSNLGKYQFSHTAISRSLTSSISPLKVQNRWLSEASEMAITYVSLQISYSGYKIILNVYVNI